MPPMRFLPARNLPAKKLISMLILHMPNCSGSSKRPRNVKTELQERTDRIRPFMRGDFGHSPPPRLLGELTHENLVLAHGMVRAAAAEIQPGLSGRAQFRLLA